MNQERLDSMEAYVSSGGQLSHMNGVELLQHISERKNLTFNRLSEVSIDRNKRWHKGGIEHWTPERWLTAITGELGEAANALKKLFRLQDEMQSINEPGREIKSHAQAIAKIGQEIGDTYIYLGLFAARLGIDVPEVIVQVFNAKSEEYGFPERL